MTRAEAMVALPKLPAAMAVCFIANEILLEVGQIEVAPTTVECDGLMETFDGTREDAMRVAVLI